MDINEIINRNTKQTLKEFFQQQDFNYELTDSEEIIEYMKVTPEETGLNMDIFVDDGGSYKLHNHPLVMFVRNSYNKQTRDFFAILVSSSPVVSKGTKININKDDLNNVLAFVAANANLLKSLADRQLSQINFVNDINIKSSYPIAESHLISEMATLRKEDSGLPVDVWLDEGGTYAGHAPRIKFKASNEQHSTREFSSMLITNPPVVENMPKNAMVNAKDLKALENFILNNFDLLRKLADGKISYRKDFLPNIK